MREIKFRCWDKLDNKIEYFTFIDMLSEVTRPSIHPGSLDWELMQYTGLKDKNGKEIYECDIVKHTDCDIGKVIFENGCFVVEERKNKFLCYSLSDGSDPYCEVIGNIYENPELLK